MHSALRSPVLALTLLTACGATEAQLDEDAPTRPPNLVLFLVDDLGWQDVSLPLGPEPTPFNARYRTPSLEHLAAGGVAFTDAYASAPVCTPTRTSLMTGQDPARTHITYWTLHKNRDTSKKREDLAAPAWRMNGLAAEDVTLARVLRAAGYRTIHAGKAHFGAHDTSGAEPRNLGFDVNIAGHASGGPGSFYGEHRFSVAGRRGNPDGEPTVWDVPGLEPYHDRDVYLTEALTAEVLDALRAAHATGQPFFLNFAPYAVHAPIMANRKLLEPYAELDPREAAYATMIESVDRALGAVLDELERLGEAERTLVVFTSDNGGLSAHARGGEKHTHNAPLKSGKGSAYEGGTRVPTVIRWPGVAPAGTREATPILTQDLFTTFVRAADAPLPPDYEDVLDGRDLAPLLRGRRAEFPPRVLGWNQPHQWGAPGPGIEPFTSIRADSWKLIYFHAGPRFELYDLEQDLGEERDLFLQHPLVVRELAGAMQRWIDRTGAQLSIDPTTGREIPGPLVSARALPLRPRPRMVGPGG